VAPTQTETVTWINISGANCQIETDKIVKNWNISTGSFRKVDIQSSSFENITADNVTTTNGWNGSGKKLVMTNSTHTAGLKFGIFAYGASDESTCTNCNVSVDFSITGAIHRVDLPRTLWSMSGGVITIRNQDNNLGDELQVRGMVPGHYVRWQGLGGGGTSAQGGRFFKVVDVTQDINNTYVQTSEAGGFPTGAWTTNGLSVAPHPAPQMTVSFTGSAANSLVYNGCPAAAPMYSCVNFVSTGGASGASSTTPSPGVFWGVIDTFTFTNNVPYTGAGTLTWTPTRFANTTQVLLTDNTVGTFSLTQAAGGILNTKLPSSCGSCTRTLTASGATNTQVGDNISPPPTDAWFGVGFEPVFSANTPSDTPQVTVTLRTNQQLPP
jgi:hypothetical protein